MDFPSTLTAPPDDVFAQDTSPPAPAISPWPDTPVVAGSMLSMFVPKRKVFAETVPEYSSVAELVPAMIRVRILLVLDTRIGFVPLTIKCVVESEDAEFILFINRVVNSPVPDISLLAEFVPAIFKVVVLIVLAAPIVRFAAVRVALPPVMVTALAFWTDKVPRLCTPGPVVALCVSFVSSAVLTEVPARISPVVRVAVGTVKLPPVIETAFAFCTDIVPKLWTPGPVVAACVSYASNFDWMFVPPTDNEFAGKVAVPPVIATALAF